MTFDSQGRFENLVINFGLLSPTTVLNINSVRLSMAKPLAGQTDTHTHTHTPLLGRPYKVRITVGQSEEVFTIYTPTVRKCVTPYTTEVSLKTRLISLPTEWGSPVRNSPRFAYKILALTLALSNVLAFTVCNLNTASL